MVESRRILFIVAVAVSAVVSLGGYWGPGARPAVIQRSLIRIAGTLKDVHADGSGVAAVVPVAGTDCDALLLARWGGRQTRFVDPACVSGGESQLIEESAYANGRAIWTDCMETSFMACSLKSAVAGSGQISELATYDDGYVLSEFEPVAGGDLFVYRSGPDGTLMRVLPGGLTKALAVPQPLRHDHPLATDGAHIALYGHGMLSIVDPAGRLVAHWRQNKGSGIEVAFAGKLVVVMNSSRGPLTTHDLQSGRSLTRTPAPGRGAGWRYSLVGASEGVVALESWQNSKPGTRVELLRLSDGRLVRVPLDGIVSNLAMTFGPGGLVVAGIASAKPPVSTVQLIPDKQLQNLLRHG